MSQDITGGEDSFLDIVANLVGILIILVVVVGAQASYSFQQERPVATEPELEQLQQQLDADDLAWKKIDRDNQDLEQQILEQNRLAAELTGRRHRLLVDIESVRQQSEIDREKLQVTLAGYEQQQREQLTARAEFLQQQQDLNQQLEAIERELVAVDTEVAQAGGETKTIEHYPNPIAKTVFSEEIHFRLADGRLSYVPLEELISQMKSEWRVKAEKLEQSDGTRETVGPIDGFRLQYELGAQQIVERTEFGPVQRRSIQFQRFQILPQSGTSGEPVEAALTAGSAFESRLTGKQPGRTTVSIWLYPDGFEDHAKIKAWLYQRGFQMASWPLDFGRPISGGPNGFKTSAQ